MIRHTNSYNYTKQLLMLMNILKSLTGKVNIVYFKINSWKHVIMDTTVTYRACTCWPIVD